MRKNRRTRNSMRLRRHCNRESVRSYLRCRAFNPKDLEFVPRSKAKIDLDPTFAVTMMMSPPAPSFGYTPKPEHR